MCPTCEPEQTNGANGTNGTSNGNHEGYTGVETRNNPRPDHVSPYKPVGDFLSNVSRFKIIGTSSQSLPAQSEHARRAIALDNAIISKDCANTLLQSRHSVRESSSPMPTSTSMPRSRSLRRLMSSVLTVRFISAAHSLMRMFD
jgi:hypothetical protein